MAKTDLAAAVHGAGQPQRSARPALEAPGTVRSTQPASRQGKRGVVVYVDPDTLRRLKHLAIDRDTTLQALGVEAFEALLGRS